MEFIQTKWQVKVDFNNVYVVGTAPHKDKYIDQYVERAMISKAAEYIEKAQKTGDCIIRSIEPEGLNNTENDTLNVAFSVMFKNPFKASEYAHAINN